MNKRALERNEWARVVVLYTCAVGINLSVLNIIYFILLLLYFNSQNQIVELRNINTIYCSPPSTRNRRNCRISTQSLDVTTTVEEPSVETKQTTSAIDEDPVSERTRQAAKRCESFPAWRRSPAARGQQMQKKQILNELRRKAQELKQRIPTLRDVNKIDKYSRTVFPFLFIVFNACYWSFYLLQKVRYRFLQFDA